MYFSTAYVTIILPIGSRATNLPVVGFLFLYALV